MAKTTSTYEDLLIEYDDRVEVNEYQGLFHKGLYCNEIIAIRRELTETEKACILAEELGHYETTTGNILDQTLVLNQRQETRARRWAHVKLIPLSKIIECFEDGCRNQYEIADHLGITEEFLKEALGNYCRIHGNYKVYGDYIIYFDPFGVFKAI